MNYFKVRFKSILDTLKNEFELALFLSKRFSKKK